MKTQMQILNSKGQPVVLNAMERRVADINQRKVNELGFDIPITTLTTIMKEISEQKFYNIPFADYLPVRVGQGAWSQVLTTYLSYQLGQEFETGVLNTGGDNSRLANADAGVNALNIAVFNWAKSIGWTLMDLQLAAKSGNWDLVAAKEESRKTNWDLGLQRIAFLGAQGSNGSGGACLGLLNQAGITPNTALITTPLSSMSTSQLKAFQAGVIGAYRAQNEYTAFPSAFIIPESDYDGLASQSSEDFPIKSTLQLLEEAFKVTCRNPNFKILPLVYAQAAQSQGVLSSNRYVLLNQDPRSIRMDIPVDYTNTLANSLDNFAFQNVGYGQFTGVLAYRPKELFYMDDSA